jgi:hypothetical protein
MAYDTQSLIDQLQAKLKVLSGYYPEAKGLFETAVAAIQTSTPRALIGEKRTAAAAKMSIISNLSAVFFVVTRHDDGGRHIGKLSLSILNLAKELAEGHFVENEPTGEIAVPDGWVLDENSVLTRTLASGDVLSITTRPHLPGGDWCLHFFNVPVSFGNDLNAVAERAGNLERLINDALAPVRPLPEVIQAVLRRNDSQNSTTIPNMNAAGSAVP